MAEPPVWPGPRPRLAPLRASHAPRSRAPAGSRTMPDWPASRRATFGRSLSRAQCQRGRRLSCSVSTRFSHSICAASVELPLGLLGQPEIVIRVGLFHGSASPASPSRSSAYSRIVCSIMKRPSPSACNCRDQALANQRLQPIEDVDTQITLCLAHRFGGASSVQPPAKTPRRWNRSCSASSSRS